METELVRISLKNADDIFGEKYWKTVFEDIITYEVTNNKKSPDYISDVERDVYNEIWETLLSDNDKRQLFEDNKTEYYFWIHNLSDAYFEKYINLMESGRELCSIIEEELKSSNDFDELNDMDSSKYIPVEDLYKRHLENDKLVTVTSTDEHMIISCMNQDVLNETKNSLLLNGYILYNKRNKIIESKTLYSYVYNFKDITLPFCPN